MQQQGGSQYGVPPPEMAPPFSSAMIGIPTGGEYLQPPQAAAAAAAEAASPINSRPAPPQQQALPRQQVSIFEDYGSGGGAMVRRFSDEDALGGGEDAERGGGGGGGNRWPRQETLALLKIRSDMDAVFRDATLKGPLWEDVSRKLAELGYARSAKKCKEKFENVHKYYKRTKEGRAGRQDGKSYRFFTQLEALHSSGGAAAAVNSFPSPSNTALITNQTTSAAAAGSAAPPLKTSPSSFPALPDNSMTPGPQISRIQPAPPAPPPPLQSQSLLELSTPAAVVGISFSSNTSSSSPSESDGEETEEGGVGALHGGGRKRKREGWPGGSRKMLTFFDGLMKQVMERQEAMQQRFLETIEKREQDRMIREEAWKRQEMARLNREYDLMAQERTMAANRDAAVISFLQKFTGGVQPNQPLAPPISPASPPEEPPPPPPPPPPTSPQLKPPAPVVEPPPALQIIERNDLVLHNPASSSEPAAAVSEMADGMFSGISNLDTISPSSSSSSRWPKPEVIALIKLRSSLDSRYLESGPKGPLWEEISLGMKRIGYSRNAKRCKEKWENINKYFKKVKESNKKRTEDAKTCPYFHELDALYRKKQLFGGAGAGAAIPGIAAQQQQEIFITQKIGESVHTPPLLIGLTEQENINKDQKNSVTVRSCDGVQMPRNNGGNLPQLFFGGAPNRAGSTAIKKPEDIVRELMGQQNHEYEKLHDSDTMNHEYDDDEEDNDDEDEDDDEEDGKLRYEIQFQRQGVGAGAGGGNSAGKVPTTAAASSAGSFLAMVQ